MHFNPFIFFSLFHCTQLRCSDTDTNADTWIGDYNSALLEMYDNDNNSALLEIYDNDMETWIRDYDSTLLEIWDRNTGTIVQIFSLEHFLMNKILIGYIPF